MKLGFAPFVLASGLALAAIAFGLIIAARQIEIGPFDEEPSEMVDLVTEYDASVTKADRTDERGTPLGNVLAILKRERENYYRSNYRQAGDRETASPDIRAFATEDKRAELLRAELSIPDALKAQLLVKDMRVHVLVHRRARNSRLLVAVSAPAGESGKP